MEKQFKVAFLGQYQSRRVYTQAVAELTSIAHMIHSIGAGLKPGDDENGEGSSWMKEIGVRTYNLNVDQILDIVEKVGPEGALLP